MTTPKREERRVRLSVLLAHERAEGYRTAFTSGVAALVHFARVLSGTKGMTKATATELRRTLGVLASDAHNAVVDETITQSDAEELRDIARDAYENAERTIGLRGAR